MNRVNILAISAVLTLCACKGNTAENKINSEYAGKYELIRIDGGSADEGIAENELYEIKKYDMDCSLILNENGTASMNIYGETENYTWSGLSLINDETDETVTFEIDGTTLIIKDENTSQALVFSKSAESPSD